MDFKAQTRLFFDELERVSKEAVIDAAKDAKAQILATKAFGGYTLRRSFSVKVLGPYEATISNGSKLGEWMEDGTPAHIIRARKAKALYFNGQFFKSVNHPGTKATKFFSNATQDASQKMEAAITDGIQKIANKFSK